MTERLTADELTELAGVFQPGPGLNSLLGQCGFPVQRLPPFNGLSSYEFWSLLNDRIAGGLVHDGRRKVLEFAAGQYPANPVFAAALTLIRKVCFVGASPDQMHVVRATRELRAVLDAVRGSDIDVTFMPAVTAGDLGSLSAHWPFLLHLSCHGDGETLVFEDRDGGPHRVPVADVADTIRSLALAANAPLDGVVLAVCRSEAMAKALLPYARTVVAHRGDLDDGDALTFAGHLYTQLRHRRPLAAAAFAAAQLTAVGEHGRPWLREGLIVLESGGADT